ncbi:MIP/aquaporin family protein [Rhabdobacter roseus]|uniref:Glycerol uptake facilitator protein n=1 Tax=Rhabdobacter roseus TaxID=1655419 RepID=A0A840TPR0_9BACT|nr:MIP/aquaporin family protein [Rhabdobacter roseus]MBB5282008.1 glycerol uptake facilitator protein [Rhabdobacter roseus]
MQTSPFIGELIGTLVLILLGNGVVANVVLKQTKGENAGLMAITTGWAFAVVMGVFTANAFGSPDAHINPAVTIAFAVLNQDFSQVGTYFLAQLMGAFLGAALVWLHYLPHWKVTPEPGDKLACFSTGPAIRAAGPNFISELLGTLLLIIGIVAISKAGAIPENGAIPSGLGPYLVGLLVWSIGLSLGGTTGYAINPARDLGPRLAHAVLPIPNKGTSDWRYAWIPVAAPLAGAVLAALFLQFFSL